jgi:hypothetical protein
MAFPSNETQKRLSRTESLLLKALACGAGWMTLVSAVYFFWKLPGWLNLLSVIPLVGIFAWISGSELASIRWKSHTPGMAWPLVVVALISDGFLFATLFLNRTDEGLISPWQALPVGIFGLFFLGSLFTLLAFRTVPTAWKFALSVIHSLAAFSVSAVVYQLGFGFDPFVHEAATVHILQFDYILPKQPFYIGQYVTVATLSRLFGLSVQTIHAWLVPIAASVLAPAALLIAWRAWTDMRASTAPLWLIWLYPFAYLTFTVPFNLALILLLLCLALLPRRELLARITRLLLAGACLVIHPLAGIPAIILTLSSEGARAFSKRIGMLTFAASALALYGALAAYTLLNDGSLSLPSLSEWTGVLRILFHPPFIIFPSAPFWSALYIAYAIWPWALTIGGGVFLYRTSGASRTSARIMLGTAAGVLLAATATAGTLRYQNIISHEQFEFAFRLFAMLPWLLLPGWLVWLGQKREILKKNRVVLLLALGMTAAWHVAYPQLNPIMHVYSPGVGRTDVATVDRIERIADGATYAALAPQLTSAAALRRIGFTRSLQSQDGAIHPYAIPTGGFLYENYLEMFHSQDVISPLRRAWDYAPIERLFVAVPYSWDDGHIDATLTPIADQRILIDESMRLYVFSKKP